MYIEFHRRYHLIIGMQGTLNGASTIAVCPPLAAACPAVRHSGISTMMIPMCPSWRYMYLGSLSAMAMVVMLNYSDLRPPCRRTFAESLPNPWRM